MVHVNIPLHLNGQQALHGNFKNLGKGFNPS